MGAIWAAELGRLAALLLVALILGAATGEYGWALFAAAVLALIRGYRSTRRVLSWLQHGDRNDPPTLPTIWGELVNGIYRLHQRNRKRKKKIGKLLRRFRESSAAMPDATVLLGEQGEIDWFNASAKTLLGLRPQQDIGRRIGTLIRHPSFTEYMQRGDFSEAVEIPSPEDEGRRLSLRIVPFGKKQSLLSARDVTRLHRLEQVRRDFVGNVSHELRTPLTVITGYLEALTDGEEIAPEAARASMLQMKTQAERMRRIVEDLLMLTRLESSEEGGAHHAEVAVPGLLAAIEEDARILSGENRHQIKLEAEAGLWLRGNPSELHSAFSNLVSNAVRYTPAGGEIRMRWYADAQGAAHYEVQDTGIGIEPQHIPRLTERFYRVDTARSRASGGTGLGLAIVKHVLQRHDARLHVESVVGKGSSFRCDFPAQRVLRRHDVKDPAVSAG